MQRSVKIGDGGDIVYANIYIDGCTYLNMIRNGALTNLQYRYEILRHIAVPYAATIEDDIMIMDKNCCHIVFSWCMISFSITESYEWKYRHFLRIWTQ